MFIYIVILKLIFVNSKINVYTITMLCPILNCNQFRKFLSTLNLSFLCLSITLFTYIQYWYINVHIHFNTIKRETEAHYLGFILLDNLDSSYVNWGWVKIYSSAQLEDSDSKSGNRYRRPISRSRLNQGMFFNITQHIGNRFRKKWFIVVWK